MPRGDRVRPTADRVREAWFAHLVHRRAFEGQRVLDCFAGTGALGIEALSRGAREAVFVERAAPVVAVLRGNLAALGLEDVARVVRGDARSVARRLAAAGERFDRILLDPPYGSDALDDVLARVPELLAEGGEAWLETSRAGPLPSPPGLAILGSRQYGDTRIVGFVAGASGGPSDAPEPTGAGSQGSPGPPGSERQP